MTIPAARLVQTLRVTTLFLAGVLASATGCGAAANSGASDVQPPASQPTRAMLLVCSPGPDVQFGVVRPGGRREGVFLLSNPTDNTIRIEEIKISCECLKVMLPCRTIEPGQKIEGSIALDLSSEPDSTGNLAVEVEGFTEDRRTAFALTVVVEIRDPEQPAGV